MSERVTSETVGPCTQRRAVLAALPGVVLLPGVLSACSQNPEQAAESVPTTQGTTTVAPTPVPLAEVPVGTAKQVKAGEKYVIVAQPTAGQVKAYSATCTHKGGTVQVVEKLHLRCPLHGAEYDATTGDVTAPPAKRGLDVIAARIQGDQILVG